jgi:hypothetical protein
MTQVTINDLIRQTLDQFSEPVELIDASGRLIGQFLPASSLPISRPSDNCPISEEELQRIRSQKGGRPLAEIWKDLGRT